MEVMIQTDAPAAARLTAEMVSREIRQNPRAVIGFATGRTMESVYARLAQMHHAEALDFSQCRAFALDEYVGLSPDDNRSFRHYLFQHLLTKVNMDQQNIHFLDGAAADLEAECKRYEQLIVQAGGIDLQLLGIGNSGHIGFNEPTSALDSRTRVVTLAPTTILQNAESFGGAYQVPRLAVTMGVGTILDCRRCLLLAVGPDKSQIVAQMIKGPITDAVPASALQRHSNCTVVLDESAASSLKKSGA